MVTCAIASQKGGVGKTTLSVNLAYSLAKRGWNVLLVDADPQGGVGFSLSPKVRQCLGFFDALLHGAAPSDVILSTRMPELRLVPAGTMEASLDADETIPLAEVSRFLDRVKPSCDIVLIDTPAGLGGITGLILRAVDWVVLPQQAEPLAVRSLPQALETLVRLRRSGYGVKLAGVVLNMVVETRPNAKDVTREIRELLPPSLFLPHPIPRHPVFLTATEKGVPLALLKRQPPPEAILFDSMAAELEKRLLLPKSNPAPDEQTRLMD